VNKERLWRRAGGALAIIALVLVTNEGYRHYRGLVDAVSQSKQDIAVLKRDLYVLQVQLDNSPASGLTSATSTPVVVASAIAPAPAAYPMPAPMAQTLPLPETPARPRPKLQASEDQKSLVSVVLMSDAKPAAPTSVSPKSNEGPKVDVQLIGDSR